MCIYNYIYIICIFIQHPSTWCIIFSNNLIFDCFFLINHVYLQSLCPVSFLPISITLALVPLLQNLPIFKSQLNSFLLHQAHSAVSHSPIFLTHWSNIAIVWITQFSASCIVFYTVFYLMYEYFCFVFTILCIVSTSKT